MVKGVVVVVVTLKDEQLRSVSHYFLNMVTTKKKHGISLLSGSAVSIYLLGFETDLPFFNR